MTDKELEMSTGLTRAMIKEYRSKMEEGVHWVREPSKRPQKLWPIKWTEAGLAKLKEMTELKPDEPIEKIEVQEAEGVVMRNDYPNVRLLLVNLGESDVTAFCKDARMFKRGMKVKIKNEGDRWTVAKHPRFFGRY
jgi:hypothetical protein